MIDSHGDLTGPPAGQPALRPLVLASGSPRRRELLRQLGIPFTVIVSDAPEDLDPALAPPLQALTLAARKARAVAAGVDSGLVLAADTIVVLGGEILGKPVDDDDASRMLRLLAGRRHEVITGVVLADTESGESQSIAVTSSVQMRQLTSEDIATYVATGEPRDKAGAYAIQGRGGALIERHEGSFTNIVGLPLDEVWELLSIGGVTLPRPDGVHGSIIGITAAEGGMLPGRPINDPRRFRHTIGGKQE